MGLPALKAKYNSRSSLLETLIPVPSEGKIRKMFIEYQSPVMTFPKLEKLNKSKSMATLTSIQTTTNKRGRFSCLKYSRLIFFELNIIIHSIQLQRQTK